MRRDQFTAALPLLPAPLRERAEALGPHLPRHRCADCRHIAEQVELALAAARYEQLGSAEQLIGAAERAAEEHAGHASANCPLTSTATRRNVTGNGLRGAVTRWARYARDLVAATDASWKRRVAGLGYIVSDGRYGLLGRRVGRRDPTGPSQVLINELRAIDFLIADFSDLPTRVPPTQLTVLTDSAAALWHLDRWQAGDVDVMPAGYDLRPRRWSTQPTLVRLAQRVADAPWLRFRHVKGHTGHPLNEAADALSSMARRRVEQQFEVRDRADDLVSAFLRDWHVTNVWQTPTSSR